MKLFLAIILFLVVLGTIAQDRIELIGIKLDTLSKNAIPGLNEKVDFSVTGITIQEFLRGIAESTHLNISIDPKIDARIYNNFTNEEVKNILVFLCKQYDLEIAYTGSIMYFYKFQVPAVKPIPPVPYRIKLDYNATSDFLSFDLRGDTLFSVIKEVNRLSGKNVILSPGIESNKLVSIYIQNADFEKAIDKLAFANALELEKSEDGFYILKKAEVVQIEESHTSRSNSRNNTRNRNTRTSTGSSESYAELSILDSAGQKYIDISALNTSIPELIIQVCEEAKINYFMFSEPKGQTSLFVSHVTFDELLSNLLNASQHTYKKEADVYLIGERKSEKLRTTKYIQLQYRAITDVDALIPSEIKEGVEMHEFEELNSFIVSGSSLQIQEIEAFIKAIDQVVPMVMIEVIIVDITRGRSLRTGLHVGKGNVDSSSFKLLPSLDILLSSRSINRILNPLNIGKVNADFYAQLSLLERQDIADIRSMPKLSTLNGHEASYTIGKTDYYEVQTVTTIGTQNPSFQQTNNFQSVEANTSLTIKPLVSGDDQVTLEIEVEVTGFTGEPSGNRPPPSSTSSFSSMVRVRNDEMVMLGGMETISRTEAGEGIPLLSRIPVIKWFFSSRGRSRSKSIQVVFIKPTIIH